MIYLDMDGVIADFDGYFEQLFGVLPRHIPKTERWDKVNNMPNYWADLPKMPGADTLITHLRKYGFAILTGVPHQGGEKAKIQKRIWLKNHYGIEVDVICCFSKDKANYCQVGDILIDDWLPNIERWYQAGGIGILHTSIEDTLKQLKRLGYA